ncbi:MAG: hypothetical protein KF708_18735 [Pirellulales bacterium]|nr:hypothetical protein [Pirellulales bacterium]
MKSVNASPPLLFRPRSLSLLLGLLFVPAFVGCGESKVPVVPVTGKLTVGTETPVGANIILHPQGHTLPEGVSATGKVGEDGNFSVSIYDLGEGVPPGEYIATVQWFKIGKPAAAGDDPLTVDVIPKKYSSPGTSPLKVTVKSEPTQLEPIVIR